MTADTIRQDVKRLREARNLAQDDAARLVGVRQAVWSDWETGTRLPSPLARRSLAFVFQAELEAMTPPPQWYLDIKRRSPGLRALSDTV